MCLNHPPNHPPPPPRGKIAYHKNGPWCQKMLASAYSVKNQGFRVRQTQIGILILSLTLTKSLKTPKLHLYKLQNVYHLSVFAVCGD